MIDADAVPLNSTAHPPDRGFPGVASIGRTNPGNPSSASTLVSVPTTSDERRPPIRMRSRVVRDLGMRRQSSVGSR